MDIYSAEKAVKKLVDYIQELSDTNPGFYKSSKQRLQNVADMCSQVSQLIANILETEMLNSDSQEFESATDIVICNSVNGLKDSVNKLHNFINDDADYGEQVPSNNTYDLLSPTAKKSIVQKYGSTLKRSAKMDCGVFAANECTNMLWRWFQARIFTRYANAPPFKYSVHRFKNIIYSFVIVYGYHIENGTLDQFNDEFDTWIDSLCDSPKSNRWVAPYEVYQLERGELNNYLNLTSVILWDVLCNNQLKPLCVPNSELYLNSYGIWEITESSNPDILDKYVNYNDNKEILHSLNLM